MKKRQIVSLIASLAFVCSCNFQQEVQSPLIPFAETALIDSSSVFNMHIENYPRNAAALPIGILDCSIDGLGILDGLLTCDYFDNITGDERPDGISDFAGEHFQMLVDAADGQFGGYVKHAKTGLLRELTVRGAAFLLGDRYWTNTIVEQPDQVKTSCKLLIIVPEVSRQYGSGDVENMISHTSSNVQVLLPDYSLDSASVIADIAKRAYRTLREDHRLALRTTEYKLELYVTYPSYDTDDSCTDSTGLFTDAYRYRRTDGTGDVGTKTVKASYINLDTDVVYSLSDRLPAACNLIIKSLN